MSHKERPIFTKSIVVGREGRDYLHVQIWPERPDELVIKHNAKEGDKWVNKGRVRIPLASLPELIKGLVEACLREGR